MPGERRKGALLGKDRGGSEGDGRKGSKRGGGSGTFARERKDESAERAQCKREGGVTRRNMSGSRGNTVKNRE